jgi:hypothetical protein
MPLCGKRIRASQVFDSAVTKGIWRVQLSHAAPVRFARFDDSCLVASAGLVPVMALAQRAGLVETAGALLTVPGLGEGGHLFSSSVVEDEWASAIDRVANVCDVWGGDDAGWGEFDRFLAV